MEIMVRRILFYNNDSNIPVAYLGLSPDEKSKSLIFHVKGSPSEIIVSRNSSLNIRGNFTEFCTKFANGEFTEIILKAYDRVSDLDCVIITDTTVKNPSIESLVFTYDITKTCLSYTYYTCFCLEYAQIDEGLTSIVVSQRYYIKNK